MTTKKQEQRLLSRRRQPRLTAGDAGPALTAQQLDELWAAYLADRSDWQLRNRLVEHYVPYVRRFAASSAKKMRMHDRQNAVGEVLAALVETIVPGYDGHSGFERWARVCARRNLIQQQRAEQKRGAVFGGVRCKRTGLDLLPDREERQSDMRFLDLTAELSDRQAIALWLRHYRGMSVRGIAALFRVSPRTVKFWTQAAVAELQKQWAAFPREDVSAY